MWFGLAWCWPIRKLPKHWFLLRKKKKKFYIYVLSFHISVFIAQYALYLIQSFLKLGTVALSWMTSNWALEGSSSPEARVTVKVEWERDRQASWPSQHTNDFTVPLALEESHCRFSKQQTPTWLSFLFIWAAVTGSASPPNLPSIILVCLVGFFILQRHNLHAIIVPS